MPMPTIDPVTIHYKAHATIWAPEALPGDVLLVCEDKHLWWRRILQAGEILVPPSVSLSGWTFLGDDSQAKDDSAWLLRGVESLEHDPGSFAQPEQETRADA